MEKNFEQFKNLEKETTADVLPKAVTVERLHSEALSGESYEDTAAAFDKVNELREFRKKISNFPFSSFYEVVEEISTINQLPLKGEEKSRQIKTMTEVAGERAGRFSPRVADLYQAMLAEANGEAYEPHFPLTQEKMAELKQNGDWQALFSGDVSWALKLNRIETRLLDYLSGARALDKREGKEMSDDIRQWREEELKKSPTRPPARRNESKPGVDPMERLLEGERAPAIWSISPAWGGYYKEQSFGKWDSQRNVWIEDKYIYDQAEIAPLSNNKDYKKGPIDIMMSARMLTNEWITLPVPYTHSLNSLEVGKRKYQAKQDQNGDVVILVEGNGEEVEVKVVLSPHPNKKFTAKKSGEVRAPNIPAEFSLETDQALILITDKKRGNIARARAIKSYVVGRIQYLAPKDRAEAENFNTFYRTHPKGFAGAVDEVKKGDCDVVNTYFAALCAKLNIPVRHVVGHSVKGKDQKGQSSIHSGTGHGWSEVWNEVTKEWARMDATPAGDSNLEESDKKGGAAAPGDYGEQEAIRPTDEQLEALRQKLAARKEELSYTKEERQLALEAGVEMKEARQIVKEINEAERTRLPNGELVIDVLARLFNAIVESRKTVAPTYDGPVRKREGGEGIEDIVRHKIGVLTGETDPLSREKSAKEIKEEKLLGGFDLYMIGDKSGSMSGSVDGEILWQMQRRAEYLIFSSLHRFERNLARAGLQKENSLSVRTQGISFRGNDPDDIDLDKSLSADFTAPEKVKMWRSLTTQGGGNGDVAALSYVYEQIQAEVGENEKRGKKDNRLRLVIACSDGGPDSPEGVHALAQKLGKLNAVVVGMGLTETAATVPIIYDTPYSHGDIAKDINDLPALVAKYIIEEAIKLFPDKAQYGAKQTIANAIAKFKNIK